MSDCRSISYNNLFFAACVKPIQGKAPSIEKTAKRIEAAKFVVEINNLVDHQKGLIASSDSNTNSNTSLPVVKVDLNNNQVVDTSHFGKLEFREDLASKVVHFLEQNKQRKHSTTYVDKEEDIKAALAKLINSNEELSEDEKEQLTAFETLDLDDEYFSTLSNIQEEKEEQQLMVLEGVQRSFEKGMLSAPQVYQLVAENEDNCNKLTGENSLSDAFQLVER